MFLFRCVNNVKTSGNRRLPKSWKYFPRSIQVEFSEFLCHFCWFVNNLLKFLIPTKLEKIKRKLLKRSKNLNITSKRKIFSLWISKKYIKITPKNKNQTLQNHNLLKVDASLGDYWTKHHRGHKLRVHTILHQRRAVLKIQLEQSFIKIEEKCGVKLKKLPHPYKFLYVYEHYNE